MIETYLLEYFICFIEEGSLLKASKRLHISQPSLSKAMQKLEDALSLKLFSRSKNRLILNENGKALLPYIKDCLLTIDSLENKAKSLKDKDQKIKIGITAPGPSIKYHEILSNNDLFNVEINDELTLINGLNNNKYDVIFINQDYKKDGYISYLNMIETLGILVSKNHPLANKKEGIHFKDVDGESFILLNNLGIWEDITRRNLPNSNLIHQEDDQKLNEIILKSSLSTFYTNYGRRMILLNDRIPLPFIDKEATLPFYIVLKKRNESLLSYFIS